MGKGHVVHGAELKLLAFGKYFEIYLILSSIPLLVFRYVESYVPSDQETGPMGINDESDIEANIQIGPTSQGMVRIFVEGGGVEIPMDFDADEAEEIADEIRAAAGRARVMAEKKKPKG